MAAAGEVIDDLIDLGAAAALADGGSGIRFDLVAGCEPATGFVIRHRGAVHGYLNRCAHVAMELDWQPGEFFDFDCEFLICATHGALYEPSSGACAGGPCAGHGSLRRLDVFERDGRIYWRPDAFARARSGSARSENTVG
jgi:nitrite reductase/ring-hydroxylating ferredoxin subunit